MVDILRNRYFDPRFIQFGLTALVLKIAVYLIQSKTSVIMNSAKSDTVVIRNGNSSATINLFGATVTSWILEGKEILFLSKKSLFDGKKAIRGGIPVVFPQFGPWEDGPQHGFARISLWTVKDEKSIGTKSVTFVLEETDSTRNFWNHRFRLEYTVSLPDPRKLKTDALIINTGNTPFSFTFLFHTYFWVPDISKCRIKGLARDTYIDKVKNGETFTNQEDLITISGPTDRIYLDTSEVQKLVNEVDETIITVQKMNLPDTVVWNPWAENAKSMSDFGDDEYKNMICIEAGVVNNSITLNPKETFFGSQLLFPDD